MPSQQTNSGGGGIGFLGALALVFITLKLLGEIGWSWLWVLSPLWIPLSLVVVLGVLWALYDWQRDRRRDKRAAARRRERTLNQVGRRY